MYKYYFKPIIDIPIAIILSIFTFPFILLLSIFIVLETAAFPIFIQSRVGKNKKLFFIFKLRTMYKNADKKAPFFTEKNDKRITKVGKLLRKTSLDELPQLWNIALGKMSFIGPRPSSPLEEDRYSKEQWKKRHLLKPGITGLAQSTKRSECTIKERIDFDLKYIEHSSFLLDVKIIWKTLLIVLQSKGTN